MKTQRSSLDFLELFAIIADKNHTHTGVLVGGGQAVFSMYGLECEAQVTLPAPADESWEVVYPIEKLAALLSNVPPSAEVSLTQDTLKFGRSRYKIKVLKRPTEEELKRGEGDPMPRGDLVALGDTSTPEAEYTMDRIGLIKTVGTFMHTDDRDLQKISLADGYYGATDTCTAVLFATESTPTLELELTPKQIQIMGNIGADRVTLRRHKKCWRITHSNMELALGVTPRTIFDLVKEPYRRLFEDGAAITVHGPTLQNALARLLVMVPDADRARTSPNITIFFKESSLCLLGEFEVSAAEEEIEARVPDGLVGVGLQGNCEAIVKSTRQFKKAEVLYLFHDSTNKRSFLRIEDESHDVKIVHVMKKVEFLPTPSQEVVDVAAQ